MSINQISLKNQILENVSEVLFMIRLKLFRHPQATAIATILTVKVF
ncbi:hypothetical protein [Nostoc sp. CCY 9925]